MRLMQVISDYIRRSILTTQGDLVVRGAALPQRLAAGAAGTYLRGQGAGVIPAWEACPTIPACRAILSANQLIPTSSWTIVELDGTDYDTTASFNTSTHRWVCPETGKYLICVCIRFNNLPNETLIGVRAYKGSDMSPYFNFRVGGEGESMCGLGDILVVSLGDEVRLNAYQDSGINKFVLGGVPKYTYLTIHQLSK